MGVYRAGCSSLTFRVTNSEGGGARSPQIVGESKAHGQGSSCCSGLADSTHPVYK